MVERVATLLIAALALIAPAAPMAKDLTMDHHRQGRLSARAHAPAPMPDAPRGTHPLGLAPRRDGLIFVPSGYRPDRPAPLIVMARANEMREFVL